MLAWSRWIWPGPTSSPLGAAGPVRSCRTMAADIRSRKWSVLLPSSNLKATTDHADSSAGVPPSPPPRVNPQQSLILHSHLEHRFRGPSTEASAFPGHRTLPYPQFRSRGDCSGIAECPELMQAADLVHGDVEAGLPHRALTKSSQGHDGLQSGGVVGHHLAQIGELTTLARNIALGGQEVQCDAPLGHVARGMAQRRSGLSSSRMPLASPLSATVSAMSIWQARVLMDTTQPSSSRLGRRW